MPERPRRPDAAGGPLGILGAVPSHARFATANLLHGMAIPGGQVDATRLGRGISALDADVLGMQEVDRCQPRSGEADQTAVAAAALGARWWRFVPAVEGTPGAVWRPTATDDGSQLTGPSYGIALVSRWQVLAWHVTRFRPARWGMRLLVPEQGLVHVPDEPRVAVAAVVLGPAGPLTVANTHLSFMPGWNVRQLRAVVRWLAPLPRPHVLLGDLNLPGRLPGWVSRYEQLAHLPTYPSWRPRVQWDHVLADGLTAAQVRAARAVALGVSDHCALRVDVDL
jgi:endonuclease/exonuclease/phosphatase family metal-dependent hydrolase